MPNLKGIKYKQTVKMREECNYKINNIINKEFPHRNFNRRKKNCLTEKSEWVKIKKKKKKEKRK